MEQDQHSKGRQTIGYHVSIEYAEYLALSSGNPFSSFRDILQKGVGLDFHVL